MQTEIGVVDKAEILTSDERWAAWVLTGVEHDRKINTRAIAALAVISGGLALWLTIVGLVG